MNARMSALCLVGLVLLLTIACSGQVVPLSAQKGSTIVIPLSGSAAYQAGYIGFGGTQVTDHQRGTMVYKLDGPTGPELVTRVTTVVYPSPHSSTGITGDQFLLAQVVSLVNIPDVPEITTGTHALYVYRRHQGIDHEVPNVGLGSITILPHQVDVGGGLMATGAPTPFAYSFGGPFTNVPAGTIPLVVPKPQANLLILGGSGNPVVYAAEFEVTFDPAVIDVSNVTESLRVGNSVNERAITWWSESAPGVLSVSMVSKNRLRGLTIAFELDDGANQILTPGQIVVQSARGWDASGAEVTPALSAVSVY